MPKLTGSSQTYKYLVANLAEGSDPSKGRNPVKIRSVFEQQNFIQIPRAADSPDVAKSADQPGTGAFKGKVSYTVEPLPTASTGDIEVSNNVFDFPSTIRIGEFTLTSDEDFVTVATATASGLLTINVTALDPGDIITIGGTDLTANAGIGRTPGSDDFDPTGPGSAIALATEIFEALDDAANSFDGVVVVTDGGDATITVAALSPGAAGNAITLATTLVTPADITLSAPTLLGGADADDTASNIQAAADALPGFSATVLGAVITVEGPAGPSSIRFEAAPSNFTLVPATGFLASGDPLIGPPELS